MTIKNKKKRIVIGLAIDETPNQQVLLLINRINYFIGKLLDFNVLIISSSPFFENKFKCPYISLNDDPSLFDFSRYNNILSAEPLKDTDVIFAFNDTLANGRKLNEGLYLFIFFGLVSLLYSRPGNYQIWAPVDSSQNCSWICPYFFIGNVGFLRTLNFIDWNLSKSLISKSDRRLMAKWTAVGWRRATKSTLHQKKIKYKTLLLERTLVGADDISKVVCKFSKLNILRMLNSIYLKII